MEELWAPKFLPQVIVGTLLGVNQTRPFVNQTRSFVNQTPVALSGRLGPIGWSRLFFKKIAPNQTRPCFNQTLSFRSIKQWAFSLEQWCFSIKQWVSQSNTVVFDVNQTRKVLNQTRKLLNQTRPCWMASPLAESGRFRLFARTRE